MQERRFSTESAMLLCIAASTTTVALFEIITRRAANEVLPGADARLNCAVGAEDMLGAAVPMVAVAGAEVVLALVLGAAVMVAEVSGAASFRNSSGGGGG